MILTNLFRLDGRKKEKIFLINCIGTHKHTYTHTWQDYSQNDVFNILKIVTQCFRWRVLQFWGCQCVGGADPGTDVTGPGGGAQWGRHSLCSHLPDQWRKGRTPVRSIDDLLLGHVFSVRKSSFFNVFIEVVA